MFSRRFYILVACSLVLLSTMACSLCGVAAPQATQPPVVVNPTVPAPEVTQPTVMAKPPLPSSTFTLTLPDGRQVVLPVDECTGTSPGGYLELHAINTQDPNDPERIEVELAGNQQGPGQYDGFYVMVSMGPAVAEELIFMGNTPAAQVTIEADGVGRFTDVAITNAANTSATYEYAVEYPFSAEWVCGQ